ncbi:TraR/DksA family transcriptional regulator [Sphingomicrobium clamense]|uniref:TraR/DksA C4-type zinc finger protein n=1 Tax=Sphingomicrobium clamense TaxID=2851013 RepID=A0ABS6V7C1_9SPHN|nr:TraR/DksA C4-type zinc finger protein [Sphingomicrobium sp. B8]MBW0145467.1 TraR/DksA C4-type zinc finger protein [Sphingomicrobium sp. B8]
MDEATARRLLEEKLAELLDEDRLGDADRATVELDQESVGRLSRMDALQVQAMAEAQARRRSAARNRIRAALKRLDDGDFGYCIECGDDIAAKRLEHDPSVTHCIKCAS